jgi:hypothetical protein
MMRLAMFAPVPLLLGCYSYVPLDAAQLEPGASVRMRISAAEAERVEPLLGRTDARQLSGLVIAADADAIMVQVPTTTQMSPGQALHQRISIPRSALFEVESRTLNRTRTALVTGIATVAVGAILIKSRVIGPGKSGPPGGGGPPEFRFIIYRVSR